MKFGLSIAIVAICIVAAAVAVYWIKTEPIGQFLTSVVTKKSSDPMVDWHIYRNEEYGFELKYPPNLILKKDNNKIIVSGNSTTTYYDLYKESFSFINFQIIEWDKRGFKTDTETPGSHYLRLAFGDWFYFVNNSNNIKNREKCTEEMVKHVPGPDIASIPAECDILKNNDYIEVKTEDRVIFYTDKLEIFWFQSVDNKQLLSQILSTFKFIEPNPYIKIISPNGDETWKINEIHSIRWQEEGLENWGDIVTICLSAYDSKGNEIKAKDDNSICYWMRDNDYLIDEPTLSKREYKWTIPGDIFDKFELSSSSERPSNYKMSISVYDNLPPGGRYQWEGLVDDDESDDYFRIIYR